MLRVDDEAASVYGYALRCGGIGATDDVAAELGLSRPCLDDVLGRLRALRLLGQEPDAAGRLTPLDPHVAAASLIAPLEAEIRDRRDLITDVRSQMSALLPSYAQARPRHEVTSPIRVLHEQEVSGSLHLAADACHREMVCVRSRRVVWDAPVAEVLTRELAALRREVQVRVLYQHCARGDLAIRAYVRRVIAGGAQVRTTNQLPLPFIVFDRELAMAPAPGGAIEVRHAAVAGLLGDVFEDLWSSARCYDAVEPGYQGAVDEMQTTIARLLAEGLTDAAIARRLGMSLRACRRHIATLLKGLGATSRFQAGTRAMKVGLFSD